MNELVDELMDELMNGLIDELMSELISACLLDNTRVTDERAVRTYLQELTARITQHLHVIKLSENNTVVRSSFHFLSIHPTIHPFIHSSIHPFIH